MCSKFFCDTMVGRLALTLAHSMAVFCGSNLTASTDANMRAATIPNARSSLPAFCDDLTIPEEKAPSIPQP
ncbi:hypothetical protein MTO96_026540 [Rhipicephalus appendiculatus]